MGDASWADAAGFIGVIVSVLWIALAIAVGVLALAPIWIASRAVSRRIERHLLPVVARWSRRRAGLPENAGPWVCPACKSVNPPAAVACYGCGGARPDDAPELRQASTDPDIFHRPPPPSHFDPALYRGPGVVPQPPTAPASPPRDVP